MGHAGRSHARVEASTRVTVFREASNANQSIQVLHPQTDVSAELAKTVSVAAGYEVDIVSGATPKTFGPDAITSATRFSDQRHAARGGLAVETPLDGLSAYYSYGWEKDYRSHTLSASARSDFLERNFTLGLAYTRNFDRTCDQNNQRVESPLLLQPLRSAENCFRVGAMDVVSRRIDVHTFEPSLVWTASPRLLLQLGGTLQITDGFQSNPYRSVLVSHQGQTPQEHVPTLRQRFAVFARANYALPAIRAALTAQGRVYRDTWDLRAATAEAGALKYVGPSILLGVHARYHKQTEAIFYRPAGDYVTKGPAGQYWTGDRELAPLTTWLGGVKLSYFRRPDQDVQSWIEELEVNVKFDVLVYRNAPGAPNSDRTGAYIAQAGLSLRL
jgi:hypothetical protein